MYLVVFDAFTTPADLKWRRRCSPTRRGHSHFGRDDILQDVFVKALREGGHFCRLESPRAWLYQVARHAEIDHHRLSKTTVPAEDTLAQPEAAGTPVDALATDLAASLAALDPDDRDVIVRCDLEGQTQAAYATAHQLTLPAVKSRILRARTRLRRHLVAQAAAALWSHRPGLLPRPLWPGRVTGPCILSGSHSSPP
ncbi:MAG: hypothetical protein JNL48_12960 [Acidobacteria bacterium]|nr:hypothetical protein [Acidobacteriota bacterium]